MRKKLNQLLIDLKDVFASDLQSIVLANDEITIAIDAHISKKVLTCLHDADEFKFDQLIDLAGVDYLEYAKDEWNTETVSTSGFSRGVEKASFGRFTFDDAPQQNEIDGPRFAVVYHLLSVQHNIRLRVKVFSGDQALPIIPSATDIWSSANWYEREAFDLYGIVFEGHPDLRRILTDYGFTGHPFRKDFPLVGHVEVRYDPKQKRVIYQPVSIEPRIGVPKVIRDDHRFEVDTVKEDKADV